MPRVVLDTNIIVSALISDSKPRELFRKGIENQFSIVTSDQMLKELTLVLRATKGRIAAIQTKTD
jgi:putative PIN family toxin of toxin-antitoxin system